METGEKDSKKVFGIDIHDPVAGGLLLFVTAVVMGVLLLIVFQLQQKQEISSFAECKNNKDSVIQESYPEVCVTKSGKHFTNPDQSVEPQVELPNSWKSYSNTRYNYRVLYPKEWEIEETYQLETRPSITFYSNEPLHEGSEIDRVSGEIKIETLYRGYGNQDKSLKRILLEQSENGFLTLLDSNKTYLLAREEELNSMTELTINSHHALLSETTAYIERDDYIFSFKLISPASNEKLDQSLASIFKQVVMSFDVNKEVTPTPTRVGSDSPRSICIESNGTWLSEYDECEGLDKAVCEEADGIYDECNSACRHNPDAEVCIQLCVETCSF